MRGSRDQEDGRKKKIKRKCVKGVGNDKEGNKRGRKNQYIQ